MDNPLLNTDGLPRFGAIRPEHVEPAVRHELAANRAQLKELVASGAAGFSALVEPVEAMQHRLHRHLVTGQPPQRGREFARAARCL